MFTCVSRKQICKQKVLEERCMEATLEAIICPQPHIFQSSARPKEPKPHLSFQTHNHPPIFVTPPVPLHFYSHLSSPNRTKSQCLREFGMMKTIDFHPCHEFQGILLRIQADSPRQKLLSAIHYCLLFILQSHDRLELKRYLQYSQRHAYISKPI